MSIKRIVLFTPDELDGTTDNTSQYSQDWNERLRHVEPVAPTAPQISHLPEVVSRSLIIILKEFLYQLTIVSTVEGIALEDISLENVPVKEYYNNPNYDTELILYKTPIMLQKRKFRRDASWLSKILKLTLKNLQQNFGFNNLVTIMENQQLMQDDENLLLNSQQFNIKEIKRLRHYLDNEKEINVKVIADITKKLGNTKDELNDRIVEYVVKMKFLEEWEHARAEQNYLLLTQKEQLFVEQTSVADTNTKREERIHEDFDQYINESLQDYTQEIETWLAKYDKELDLKEQETIDMRIKVEQQREDYQKLAQMYEDHKAQMEDYIEHKRQKQLEYEENQRRNQAATLIQFWWRRVMMRKGLGPYRRRKHKGKKGRGGSGSKKKKK